MRRTVLTLLSIIAVAIVAAGLLALSSTHAGMREDAQWRWLAFAANVLILGGYVSLWALVVRREAPALATALVTVGAVAFVNAYKVREMAEPLVVFDLLQVSNVSTLVRYVEPPVIAAGLAAATLLVGLTFRPRRSRGPRRAVTAKLALIAAAAVTATSFASPGDSWAKRWFQVADIYWDPLAQHQTNGFVVATLVDLPMLSIRAPERYEHGREKEILEPYLGCDRPLDGNRRHVVLTLLESFWDPTVAGLGFDTDPLPFYHQLRDRAVTAQFVSPVFGGRTANAEFEVLTGISTSFSPPGAIPYQQYVKRPIESIVTAFREAGYRTVAIHNFRRDFWNRGAVYRHLGFDEYIALEDLGDVTWELGWPSDGALFDHVQQILERADRPTFVFAITVATHGPYDRQGKDVSVRMTDPASPAVGNSMSAYASKLRLLDDHLGRFVKALDDLPEPPILVAFADHLPTVASHVPGLDASRLGTERYVVDAFALGADQGAFGNGTRSLMCLGPDVLRLAGISQPPFFRFVAELCERVPAVAARAFESNEDDLIERYRWLSYDRLFGESYSSGLCGADAVTEQL